MQGNVNICRHHDNSVMLANGLDSPVVPEENEVPLVVESGDAPADELWVLVEKGREHAPDTVTQTRSEAFEDELGLRKTGRIVVMLLLLTCTHWSSSRAKPRARAGATEHHTHRAQAHMTGTELQGFWMRLRRSPCAPWTARSWRCPCSA